MSIEEFTSQSAVTHYELDQDQLALPDIEAGPPNLGPAGRLKRLGHSILRLAGAGALASALPLAASYGALELAPPVTIGSPIAGAQVSAQLKPGTNAENINFHLASLHQTSSASIGPLHLGADVTFNYDKMSLAKPNGKLDTQKIQTIIKDFSDPSEEQNKITSALEEHYALYCGISFGAVAAAEAGVLGYLAWRRKQLAEAPASERDAIIQDRRLPRALGKTALTLAAAGLLIPVSTAAIHGNHDVTVHPDKTLAAAGLHSFSITGPGRAIIDTLVTSADDFFHQENLFYAAERDSFSKNFKALYGTNLLPKQPGTKRIIFADDFQGQSGPASVVGLAAKEYGADLIVIGGDTTATALPLETIELDELHHYAGDIPAEISRGHHDPPASEMQQMVKAYKNYHIADGQVHEIGGLYIVGFNAPDIIPYSSDNSHLVHPDFKGETVDQASQKLKDNAITIACSANRPIIAEMHDQLIGTPLSEANCPDLPLVLTGREYYPQPPRQYSVTTEFISGSTGAHTPNESFGLLTPITSPATFIEVTIDASNYRVLSAKRITLSGEPETDVTISAIHPSTNIRPIITSPSNN